VRLKTSTVCAAVALCLSLPAGAQGATTARIKASFAPDKLSAATALTLAIGYTGPPDNVPEPVRKMIVHLPAGLGLFPPHGAHSCPKSRLQANGSRGCPASAKIGSGSAQLGAHLGTLNLNEPVGLTAWQGPAQGLNPTLELAGQGLSPLEERVVISAVLPPDNAPYGMELVMTVPPIATIPTEPDASMLHFSLTLGTTGHRAGGSGLIHVPSHCPAGGFPFAAEFTYADGSTGEAATKVPCP
jgi:hypothetical protein